MVYRERSLTLQLFVLLGRDVFRLRQGRNSGQDCGQTATMGPNSTTKKEMEWLAEGLSRFTIPRPRI